MLVVAQSKCNECPNVAHGLHFENITTNTATNTNCQDNSKRFAKTLVTFGAFEVNMSQHMKLKMMTKFKLTCLVLFNASFISQMFYHTIFILDML